MATTVAARQDLLTDERDAKLAQQVLTSLEGPDGFLVVERTDTAAQPFSVDRPPAARGPPFGRDRLHDHQHDDATRGDDRGSGGDAGALDRR
ncbi:MAG: hypothetical protein NVV66_09215 [Cellulomonas sp.]|uniref:hypothetical protein n=1 Tax=Cellulomonas sp. TaxID=40001 RepID=UPI002587DA55|nr:hypothetical protein [Cellulomonas sp.]MCR6704851.1 hypothetical protein [Cellulomonas sp.]